MCYLFFLFVTKSLHRHKVTFILFFLHICQNGDISRQASIFCKTENYMICRAFILLTEHQQFPLSRSKVGQLVDWLFSQRSESPRNTDKELWPVGKLSFTVSISRKDKNLLYCTSDPAS